MKRLVLLAACVLGCGSGSDERETATLDTLTFEIPAQWKRTDYQQRGLNTAQWSPAENDRSESLVVMRSQLAEPVAKSGKRALLQDLLARAQGSLVGLKARPVSSLTSTHGFDGARVEVEFRSPKTKQNYRRIHVVLVEPGGTSLVHVLYTAKKPDPNASVLESVLRSIRQGEG
jgi:hypothetical protein